MTKQAEHQAELHKQLWAMANELRGNMAAANFKDYILGLIFYRFLSENLEEKINQLLEENDENYSEAWEDEEFRELLIQELVDNSDIGYLIEPDYLYSSMINKIEVNKFNISVLAKAITNLNESTMGHSSQEDFEGLFEDMDLNSSKLGKGEVERSSLIAKVMLKVNEIDFKHEDTEIDVLGDAYEYLIGQFAANAGKKAGEFYTPQAVSTILAKIVSQGKGELRNVYDPTCGSGSLLLRVAKHTKKVGKFFGQENEPTTYNLARMNMLLHKVPFRRFDIFLGDTLGNPCPRHEELKFDAIVANPPYSAKWSADEKFLQDERFSAYGRLAPKSKADFAFVQHMIHHLDDKGTMAVVLPHGVLFRGAAEGIIRKYIINDKNYLDAVIGLPANLFFGTGIPTCVLVFKKCRKQDDNIMFIDASKEFEKVKTQNMLTNEHIDKIVTTYTERTEVKKYSRPVILEEIIENDFNLNIPRYVDTFEEEEEIDLEAVANKIIEIDKEMIEIDKEIKKFCEELGIKAPII